MAVFAVHFAPLGFSQTATSSASPTSDALPNDPSVSRALDSSSPNNGEQTKRILGIIPNFRSVSVDAKLPPLSPRNKFKLMLQDSFDYSSFIYVGIIAGAGQAESSYPEFHQGAAGYGRYYWHSFADTLDGNLMSEAVVPTLTREDLATTRSAGVGLSIVPGTPFRAYSSPVQTKVTVHLTSPKSWGNGAAAGIANFYYPRQERTWTKTGQRWVAQVGLDGAANLLKEYWPYLNSKLFRGKY